jgi:hypothetical protein
MTENAIVKEIVDAASRIHSTLGPGLLESTVGVSISFSSVVFPTGIDQRDDFGTPDRVDVYYGMADSRIGVARLDVPDFVPTGGVADPPEAKV